MTQSASSKVIKMRMSLDKLLFLLPLITLIAWTPNDTLARGTPDGFADLAEQLLPSVVTIETSQKPRKTNQVMVRNLTSHPVLLFVTSSKNLISAAAIRRAEAPLLGPGLSSVPTGMS